MNRELLKNSPILVIANSARMLVQSLKQSNYSCLITIDCFVDTDTKLFSEESIQVNNLSLSYVKPILSNLAAQYPFIYILFGSGLESYPETLVYLYQHFEVLNNNLESVLAVQNKSLFFFTLKQLNLPFPETCFMTPHLTDDWLVKPLQGEGGVNIKYFQNEKKSLGSYWQKFQAGIAMSVLFVANGSEFQVIGFNKQTVIAIETHCFIFSSIITQPEIEIKEIRDYLLCLVIKFSLKGLNSLDFIWHKSQCYLLEINPRPSASMQLYSNDLLKIHLDSLHSHNALLTCDFIKNKQQLYQAYQIVFAEQTVLISKQVLWQHWVSDRPQAGTLIYTGQPICSIIAGGKNEQIVNELLLFREQLIKQLLYAKDL